LLFFSIILRTATLTSEGGDMRWQKRPVLQNWLQNLLTNPPAYANILKCDETVSPEFLSGKPENTVWELAKAIGVTLASNR
jgi:hypothetical protein